MTVNNQIYISWHNHTYLVDWKIEIKLHNHYFMPADDNSHLAVQCWEHHCLVSRIFLKYFGIIFCMNWLSSKFKKVEVDCYLCCRKVAFKKWENGSHRLERLWDPWLMIGIKYFRISCMLDNFGLLEDKSSEQQLHCPKCGLRMRLWLDKVRLSTKFKSNKDKLLILIGCCIFV